MFNLISDTCSKTMVKKVKSHWYFTRMHKSKEKNCNLEIPSQTQTFYIIYIMPFKIHKSLLMLETI